MMKERLFKNRAREKGANGIMDLHTTRLEPQNVSHMARMPIFRVGHVRIISNHERDQMLLFTSGFYTIIRLACDAGIVQKNMGRPFQIEGMREIQL